MTASPSPSPESRFGSPEAYLAELDIFVRRVETPNQGDADDAQELHVFLAQAEAYLQAGRYEVAAAAYERLLTVMRQFETVAAPAPVDSQSPTVTQFVAPAEGDSKRIGHEPELESDSPAGSTAEPSAEPQALALDPKPESDSLAGPTTEPAAEAQTLALEPKPESDLLAAATAEPPAALTSPEFQAPAAGAATTRRRIVHVERKKIRPYRSAEASASAPEVDEIQRAAAPAGYRPVATIPTTAVGPSASRRWLLLSVILIAGVALGGLVYRDTIMSLVGLGNVQTPTSVATIGRTAPITTPAPAGRTPSAIQLPTNIVTTHIAPTNALSASTQTSPNADTITPALTATRTVVPSITPTPTNTETPLPSATPTATSTATPLPTPAMVFTGPDPLAGTTGVLFSETFEPRVYYWGVGETSFSRSRIKDGMLEISLKARNAVVWLFAGVPDTQDFFAMITVTSPNCDGGDHFGLNFRAVNDGTQFQFGITCDGRYRLQDRQNGAVRLVVLPTPSDAIKRGPGAVNELGVRGEGKQISLYVNRQFLTRVDVDTLTKGRFGAYVNSTATSDLTAQFSKFISWGMKAP